jgi:hypothetical protein
VSNIASAALLTRLREVLVEGRGSVRTITAARFDGDFPEGLSDPAQLRRAIVKPLVRADVRTLGRSKSSPPINGNILIYDIKVTVVTMRAVERRQQLVGSLNDTLFADSLTDQDLIIQALTYPRNLTTTHAGTATGLISGLLEFADASTGVVRAIDDGAQKLESTLTFTGWLQCAPAVA